MIRHIVLTKFKDGTSEDAINEIYFGRQALTEVLPGPMVSSVVGQKAQNKSSVAICTASRLFSKVGTR